MASWTEIKTQQGTVKAIKRIPEGTLPFVFMIRLTFLHEITACLIPSSHYLGAHVEIEKTGKTGTHCQAKSTRLVFLCLYSNISCLWLHNQGPSEITLQ